MQQETKNFIQDNPQPSLQKAVDAFTDFLPSIPFAVVVLQNGEVTTCFSDHDMEVDGLSDKGFEDFQEDARRIAEGKACQRSALYKIVKHDIEGDIHLICVAFGHDRYLMSTMNYARDIITKELEQPALIDSLNPATV